MDDNKHTVEGKYCCNNTHNQGCVLTPYDAISELRSVDFTRKNFPAL